MEPKGGRRGTRGRTAVALASGGREVRTHLVAAFGATALLLLLLGGAAGYMLGEAHSGVTVRRGLDFSTTAQADVAIGGWVYDIPLDSNWFSADGTFNEGSRPSCVEPAKRSQIQFGTVTVAAGGVTWRQVVWVKC